MIHLCASWWGIHVTHEIRSERKCACENLCWEAVRVQGFLEQASFN